MLKVPRFLLQHWLLWILLVMAFGVRALYLFQGVVPFAFDHGKDALAIMDMVLNLSPKLVGPWTSIQGLYSGPGWYYLLAPFFFLFGFSPLAGAWTMVLMILVQIVLAYKFLGKYEAVLVTLAPLWMIMSRSAWNPYPITFTSLILVILFLELRKKKTLLWLNGLYLGIVASLGFHFCAAYAFFYPLVIIVALLLFRVKVSLKSLGAIALGFLLPFIPQIAFEIKNNFVETKAVIHYFSQGEPHAFSLEKISLVLNTTSHEILLSFIPEMTYLGNWAWPIALGLLLVLAFVFLRNWQKNTELQTRSFILVAFTVLPIIGFFFLHFNLWYIYALAPAAVAVIGTLLRKSPRVFVMVFIGLLLAGQVAAFVQYWQTDKAHLSQARGFLPTQLKTLQVIRDKAAARPFASYHYVRDIYDFTYQYLYFWQAVHGQPLPTEFSYQPNETVYIVQKNDLLKLFPTTAAKPEVIFLVVEKPEHQEFLDQWWYRQQYQQILETIQVAPDVTVYVAQP